MQWAFFILALFAILAELNTGTFYLAGVALAALLTAFIAIWWSHDLWLVVIFAMLCGLLTLVVRLYRPTLRSVKDPTDFDIGQPVTVLTVHPEDNREVTVMYRGATWQAVIQDGSLLPPQSAAVIVGRSDNILHLARQTTPIVQKA
ncbi:NfeD family protein [Kozakia baliensis]|uniref:Uncharacterized protein n=2 Tax=Kozakia baliensis TaxID=153496 RepID=A0A1D8UR13_9PROT|nr:NfeD family protein [Kozakia baliensis]AOX16074.1 hypothetical protein A0U89_01810 [Kozakia baliensis]GBR23158.1 hypothetical protein AA0488_0064 [Kozakia baliensis NRIC 0488]GEL65115.1 hypothetical protein KBA01_24010 [Kozakia baliensis]